MIFVILGSQKFQFDRLLKELDKIVENKKIKNKIFAQVGYSTYKPEFYEYTRFLDMEDFKNKIEEADLIITHGGTGAIINSIKRAKKVIAVPRLSKYGEHVDNHQEEIVEAFKKKNYIEMISEIETLEMKILDIEKQKFEKFVSNTEVFIEKIETCLI